MSGRYDDIIHLPHHVSKKRKQMSAQDRAAQFSPFAALTGYDAAIAETGRRTDSQVEFAVDATAMLDEKLRCLAQRLGEKPTVTVTYFVPDPRKSGGTYVEAVGRAVKLDSHQKKLTLEDGTTISFDRIYDVQADWLAAD